MLSVTIADLDLKFIERPIARHVFRVITCEFLPTSNDRIDVQRVEFDPSAAPADPLSCDDGGPATEKTVKNDIAAPSNP